MKSNPELDYEVAEKVMGWRSAPGFSEFYAGSESHPDGPVSIYEWRPSTSDAHAFEVVDKLLESDPDLLFLVEVAHEVYDPKARRLVPGREWIARFELDIDLTKGRRKDESWVESASTRAEAICRAALKAVP